MKKTASAVFFVCRRRFRGAGKMKVSNEDGQDKVERIIYLNRYGNVANDEERPGVISGSYLQGVVSVVTTLSQGIVR